MKLKNIFKKETKSKTASKVQPMDKKQLARVIGGADAEREKIVTINTSHVE